MRQELGAPTRRLRGKPGAEGVGIDLPLRARHAHQGQASGFRPEIVAEHVVDEDHVGLAEFGGPRDGDGIDGLGTHAEVEPDVAAQAPRPGSRRQDHGLGLDAAGAGLHPPHAALAAVDLRDRRPRHDPRPQLLGAAPEALHRLRRIGVAAVGLIGRAADVLHVGAGLKRLQLGRGERRGVDADAPQHLDISPQVLRVGRRHHVHEAGAGEHGRPAHQLAPVLADREARPRQPRIPLVGVVHADERARAPGSAARERALLHEQDLDASGRQRIGDAGPVDPAADHHHLRRLDHVRRPLPRAQRASRASAASGTGLAGGRGVKTPASVTGLPVV